MLALALIEAELERGDLSLSSSVDLFYARVETLLVMGRLSEGYAVLAKRLERPREPGDYIRRCWLWAAQRELGLIDAAREELEWLDSDAHVATRNDPLCIFWGASFFAVFGELDIAERMLVRMLRARTMAEFCTPDMIEGNTRLGWLASRGVAGDAGAAWGEGLLDRVQAEANRLGPL
ncbi:MAG: hypothetical protein IAG13_20685 [Deltaproteobacteria bacterium]|nr:hypothetical protein [Nannocystaceae bacterium]